jgi:branched-chain amino acid transport system substrate-binding protein
VPHYWRRPGVVKAIALLLVLVGAAPRHHTYAGSSHDGMVVTIGVSVPRLQYHDISSGIIHAVQLAATQANNSGAMPGVTFAVRVLDDTINGKHNQVEDVSNAKNFVADPTVIGEIGQITTDASQATAAIYNNAQMVQISPADVNPDLTDPAFRATYEPHTARDRSPITFYRTISSDAFQGRAGALFAYRVLHVRSVYVTDDGDGYGTTLANGFRVKIAALGANVIGFAHADPALYQFGATDLASTIVGAGGAPDMVYFGGTVGPGGGEFLVDALKTLGLNTIFMGGDGIFDSRLISATHHGSALGAYATSPGPFVSVYAPAKSFLKAEARLFPGVPASAYDTQAYDAASTIIDAYSRAVNSGSILPGDRVTASVRGIISAYVASTKLIGATGPISFDGNGDIKNHLYSVYKIVAGSKGESWSYAGLAPSS